MPFYEYICPQCEHKGEVWMRIDESFAIRCDHCGGLMKRAISVPLPPVFKGKGFHETDYKDKK